MSPIHRSIAITLALSFALPLAAETFRSDSKRFADSKMDIVFSEVERLPRVSVVTIEVTTVGSSVGSSFFIACSMRDLARLRGNYRYVVKVEGQPQRHQMLIGFLDSMDEAPEQLDSRLAGQTAVDLEQFSPICDMMK